MTLLHRAYALAHAELGAELLPVLHAALETDEGGELSRFIDAHLEALTDPYEGEPLSKDWREALESGTVQELGDFALTKYYDGDLDIGLDADWLEVRDALEQAKVDGDLLRGAVLGPPSRPFDPSGNGSYFQSAAEVRRAAAVVAQLESERPDLRDVLSPLRGMLGEAARLGRGLYVTF